MIVDVVPPERDEDRLRAFVERTRALGQLRLPPEPELADKIGVTRARLRGLLKRLEAEGLIWRHVGKGTFVGERSLTSDIPLLNEVLNPAEAFEARLVLEPQLAALSAIRATTRQIDEMRQYCTAMKQLSRFEEWAVLDERLHRLVAKSAANQLLLALYDTVRESTPTGMRDRIHHLFTRQDNLHTDDEHDAYVNAIAARDPVLAEATMRDHLRSVRKSLFGSR